MSTSLLDARKWRSVVLHPLFAVTIGAAVVYLACAFLVPDAVLWLTSEEGPGEHPQPILLAVAVGLWIAAGRRAKHSTDRSSRLRVVAAVGMSVYLLFVLMEEINWGEVYGVDLGYSLVRRLVGAFAFHSARAPGEPWKDPNQYVVLPVALFFALPLIPAARTRQWCERLAPGWARFDEAVVFFLMVALDFAVFVISPLSELNKGGEPFGDARSVFQTLVYLLLLLIGWRASRQVHPKGSPA